MNTKYFEENTSEGLLLVQEAISKLEIEVTDETTVQDLHRYHNAITSYVVDRLLEKIKK